MDENNTHNPRDAFFAELKKRLQKADDDPQTRYVFLIVCADAETSEGKGVATSIWGNGGDTSDEIIERCYQAVLFIRGTDEAPPDDRTYVTLN